MSKRAEELARAVAKSVSDAIHTPIVLDIYGSAVDLIDAELRKERERCAERMTAAYDGHGTIRNLNAMKAAVLKADE